MSARVLTDTLKSLIKLLNTHSVWFPLVIKLIFYVKSSVYLSSQVKAYQNSSMDLFSSCLFLDGRRIVISDLSRLPTNERCNLFTRCQKLCFLLNVLNISSLLVIKDKLWVKYRLDLNTIEKKSTMTYKCFSSEYDWLTPEKNILKYISVSFLKAMKLCQLNLALASMIETRVFYNNEKYSKVKNFLKLIW